MLRLAVVMLFATVVAGTLAYHYVEGWLLFDSFYMVVITLSTVGYREVFPLSATGKLVTIGVIGLGLALLTLLGASVTRLILEGELEAVVGKRRMERDITSLSSHYIVCGYGRVGRWSAASSPEPRHPLSSSIRARRWENGSRTTASSFVRVTPPRKVRWCRPACTVARGSF